MEAERQGADYVGVGPIFSTTTKQIKAVRGVKLLERAATKLKIPCFAIGGINLDNLDLILRAGCNKVVVGSAILDSRDIAKTCWGIP